MLLQSAPEYLVKGIRNAGSCHLVGQCTDVRVFISKTAIASARVSSLDWVRVPSDVNWPSQGTVHDQKKKEKKLLMSGEPHLCG